MFNNMGILIAFEGISGSGKSESVEDLLNYLVGKGHKACVIEWNSNQIIRMIVQKMYSLNILTSGIYSFFQWMSFLMDYFFKITPLLKRDYILIADRYVYTGITRDIVNGAGHALGNLLHSIIIKPDLIFFYDVDPRVCYDRIKERGKILFHPNKIIQGSKILKNKDLYYIAKLRKEYLRLFNSQMIRKESKIVLVNDFNEIVKEYVEDYISCKMEMGGYVKKFNW
jgi:dTMP kinase